MLPSARFTASCLVLALTLAQSIEAQPADPGSLQQLNRTFSSLTARLTPTVVQVLSNSYAPATQGTGRASNPCVKLSKRQPNAVFHT